jgi:hypothetical protein
MGRSYGESRLRYMSATARDAMDMSVKDGSAAGRTTFTALKFLTLFAHGGVSTIRKAQKYNPAAPKRSSI